MADKIVAEYTVKVDKAIKDLEKLAKKVDKVDDERKKTQDGFKSMSSGMVSDFKKVGTAIGLAFGAQEIISFGKEAVKLASQMEGVERAFKRIGGANSANLLDGLRKATRGTVSDLQLMQKAVQASNFKIPLENLASLFKFAQARARETGESVEYLTNSIVLGIGRKSPLILDNLGISAVELRSRLKGVGVEAANVGDIAAIIGDIAEEELAKMGDQADTTADKIAQIGTAFENIKTQLGGVLIDEIENLSDSFEGLFYEVRRLIGTETDTEAWSEILSFALNSLTFGFKIAGAVIERFLLIINNVRDGILELGVGLGLIDEEVEKVSDSFKRGTGVAEGLAAAFRKINEAADSGKLTNYVTSINSLNAELKEYQKDLKDAEVGSSEFFAILDKVTSKTKELNEAIAMTKLADALKVDVETDDSSQDGFIQAQLDFLEKEFPEATTSAVDYADQLWSEHFQKKMEMNEEEYQQWLLLQSKKKQEQDLETQRINAAFEATTQIFNSFVAIQGAAREEELRGLEEQLNQGLIAREDYEKRRKEILTQQAEDEKGAAIFEATVNGALAIVNAYNTDPTGVLAGIVGAIVAAQVAAIAAQPVPQYEKGGFVDSKGAIIGGSHKQGGVIIEAEGGEYITSKKYAKGNSDILEAINSGQWEKYKFDNIIAPAIEQVLDGGIENIGSSIVLQNKFNDKNMLRAFDRNRSAARQDAEYVVRELSKNFKGRLRGGFN